VTKRSQHGFPNATREPRWLSLGSLVMCGVDVAGGTSHRRGRGKGVVSAEAIGTRWILALAGLGLQLHQLTVGTGYVLVSPSGGGVYDLGCVSPDLSGFAAVSLGTFATARY
jgi:hypothetical protein